MAGEAGHENQTKAVKKEDTSMKGMSNVQEIFQAPPPGTYPVVVAAAEATVSNKGNSMITLTLEVADGQFKGEQFMDWVLTDPTAKGAGLGRTKMRVLLQGTPYQGLADAAETAEVPDSVIAQALVGQRLFTTIDNSPRKRKDDQGNRTNENMTQIDPATGQLVTIMNAEVKGYTRHATSQAVAQGHGQQTNTFVPQQPVGMQTAAMPTTGYVQQTQTGQPVGFIQPNVTGAPVQGAATPTGLPFQPNFAPGAAVPPWQANANGAQGTEQPATRGRTRKMQVPEQQQG